MGIAYYNCTAYEMLVNEIGMILPTFQKDKRHKRDIIGCLISGFIGLAYEGISSFCITNIKKHCKRQ